MSWTTVRDTNKDLSWTIGLDLAFPVGEWSQGCLSVVEDGFDVEWIILREWIIVLTTKCCVFYSETAIGRYPSSEEVS